MVSEEETKIAQSRNARAPVRIMPNRIKNVSQPYGGWTSIGYVVCILVLIVTFSFTIDFGNRERLLSVLPYLGQVMGTAFAFIFSTGIYITRRYEKIISLKMTLFDRRILAYILAFCSSVMLPFVTYITKFESNVFTVFIIVCFGLSTVCLSLIPLSFESIRRRFQPQRVLQFLRKRAIKNIERSSDWSESWECILEIDRICMSLYKEEVDVFSDGIKHVLNILSTGAELMKKGTEIIINGESRSLNEWIILIETRIIWIGQRVIADPLAFERVLISIVNDKWLSKWRRSDVFGMSYGLCTYADQKIQQESLEKGLYYILSWCAQINCSEESVSLLKQLKNQDAVNKMINILRVQDKDLEEYFFSMGLIRKSRII